ncbi:MAG: hypothetical protein PHC88_07260 [Terrimicrobiaceae bacterium]|nr:hypothetical protein [Terrimicrobiaceae bacterium]
MKTGINTIQRDDLPVHHWYRFVLSYPPHLVRQFTGRFDLGAGDRLLDPFCGTGTTLVEAKLLGIPGVGCDAHPLAVLVSSVKTNFDLEPDALRKVLRRTVAAAQKTMSRHNLAAMSMETAFIRDEGDTGYRLNPEEEKILPTGFMSERPLLRLLILRDEIERQAKEGEIRDFFFVALCHVIARGAGNFAFGPEIYRTKAKEDYDVLGHFARQADLMISELEALQRDGLGGASCEVHADDARELRSITEPVTAVITSPPYPNEKDYTRTTRVESLLLKLFSDRADLRGVKESLLRSNTRNVFVNDRDGDEVAGFASIRAVCEAIENRRMELGKTSGFERLYHKVVAHYFGGMRRHFRALHSRTAAGAKLAYVVGDQLSFLMVPVRTAALLSEVAAAEGFDTCGIELWRERVGTKVRNSATNAKTVRVAEEILILEKRS